MRTVATRTTLAALAALAVIALACGREAPTGPGARPGGAIGFHVTFPKSETGFVIDSLAISVFSGPRLIAGPELQPYTGGFRSELQVPSGAGRVAVVSAFGEEAGNGAGTLYLGVSSPFTVAAGETTLVEIGTSYFVPNFDEGQGNYTGSATLTWPRVPNATRYTVREEFELAPPIYYAADDTFIVIQSSSSQIDFRTFRVRAENFYTIGAFSFPITIELAPPGGASNWTILNDGSLIAPAPRVYQASAWDPTFRTLYVFGGQTTSGVTDSALWAFSAVTNSWTPLFGTATGPAPKYFGTLTVSPDGNTIYYFGGIEDPPNATTLLDLWRYDRATGRWSLLETTGEAAQAAMPSEASQEAFLYAPPSLAGNGWIRLYIPSISEIWTYILTDRFWLSPKVTGPLPPRHTPITAFDPRSEILWVYGGMLDTGLPDSTLWGFTESNVTWTQLNVAGTPPPGRYLGSGAAPGPNGGVLCFGGLGTTIEGIQEVWECIPPSRIAGASWKQHVTGDPITAYLQPGVAYDGTLNRAIVFGGGTGIAAVRALDLIQFKVSQGGTP